MENTFRAYPVGIIRKENGAASLEIFEEFVDGLLGIEQFSHLILLCWFQKSDTKAKRSTLRVHPRADKANPLTGVFATRSPRRPNPVAIYVSRVREIHGNQIAIDPIDALDGTPVIDIKPYIPLSDSIPDAKVPEWAAKVPKKKES